MRWFSALWLWVVWVLLWGTFTPLTLVGGVVVAVAVLALFPARPLRPVPLRPGPLLGLVGFLALDLVRSSLDVSRETLRYGSRSRGAILELPLASTSDRVVALIAAAYTLSPGTLVLQIDHARSRWYIYVLGPRDAAGIERARRAALDVQRRVLAVVGGVMTVVFAVVAAMLALAGLLTLVRLFRGPHALDRIAALDVFVVLLVAGVSVYVAFSGEGTNVPLLVAFALLAFVGSAAAARLTERRERHR